MTVQEAIQAKIGLNYPIEENTFLVALEEAGVSPSADFQAGKQFDRALVSVIDTLVGSAERISEGGYTVQLDLEALLKLRGLIARKWGWPEAGPYLIDRTCRW